jgi:hypothetical protein
MSYDDIYANGAKLLNPAAVQCASAGGLASQQLAAKQQAPVRERLQEANKRMDGISANLSHLVSVVLPPPPISGIGQNTSGEVLKDSTLSGDMDDLLREIGRIEQHVSRLSVAISG